MELRPGREQVHVQRFEPPLGEEEVAFAPLATFEARIDDLLATVGLRPLGTIARARWIEIDREGARRLLLHALHRDLAYGTRLRAQDVALAMTTSLFDGWPAPARFLVNSDLYHCLDVAGETPIAFVVADGAQLGTREFEASLVAITPSQLSVVAIADDD